ncbi:MULTISPECIES: recombination-associated protein RdgC [unclassified Tepidimonas]|uniref:recombination-associated protein RdgC n=1 Tax=unclassified Tepidimonas TaxID=2631705 RepID=UPI003C7B97E8
MFKNLTVFRLGGGFVAPLEAMEQALATQPFHPCGPNEMHSQGWVPPRGQPHAPLVESVAGHRLMRFRIESKRVPAAVVKRELQGRCAQIEATEGRQPGRREQRELKEQIVQALLPMAFAQTVDVLVWMDVAAGRVALDTTSTKRVDAVVTALVKALDGLRVEPLQTAQAPATAMAGWLASPADDWPAHFAPGREVELKADGDSPAVVRYSRHVLDGDEMQRHLAQGKRPTRLALDWDGRVSFVLTETWQLRRIAFQDGVFEDNDAAETDGFDGDAAITTGELSTLLGDLIAALGGTQPQEITP